jgi:SNF2 family DNA or RNA helicase
MVLMEPDWNPSVDLQVMGRIWRQGQTKPCYIFRLFGLNTVEESVLYRQQYKLQLEGNVLDSQARTAKGGSH